MVVDPRESFHVTMCSVSTEPTKRACMSGDEPERAGVDNDDVLQENVQPKPSPGGGGVPIGAGGTGTAPRRRVRPVDLG